jgi:hypothetical protein
MRLTKWGMTMKKSEDLFKNYQRVNRYKDELMSAGGFYQLPVVSRLSMDMAVEIIKSNNIRSVLDIGANERRFEKHIISDRCRYYSLDQDETYEHDFRSLQDVEDNMYFGMITMFAVIEHIEKATYIDEFIPFFLKHLEPFGYLIISSNNIFHNLGIRTDYSHVTSYSPRDLHAIMRNFDFETIGVYRISLMSRRFRWFFDLLSITVFKPYCLDYAKEICWIFRYKGK